MVKKLNLESINLVRERINAKLFNYSLEVKHTGETPFFFEQYKMLVDSTQKIEERRRDSNTIFITVNSIFFTVLTQVTHFSEIKFDNLLIVNLLLAIGVIICWNWLSLISSYKIFNYVNYAMIDSFENRLPVCLFSLRTDIIAELEEVAEKGNVLLEKETLIPKLFLSIYLIYMVVISLIFCLS